MEPPPLLFKALHAAGAGGRNTGVDAWDGFHGGLLWLLAGVRPQ